LAISKERKQSLVEQYKQILSDEPGMVITAYSGLSVRDLEGLRRKISDVGGEFHIVKNTLIKLAVEEVGIDLPEEAFVGTTAIGFTHADVPGVAKAIVELARELDTVYLKAGMVDGVVYDGAQMALIAELPPLSVLQSQLLSVIQAPATKTAGTLASSVRQVINVVKAYGDQEKEVVS
jgi:large subunit ribosomal protein L10